MASPEDDLARFARRLREARHDRGWSQERLADESGLHWTAVSKIERGEREPRLGTIMRLARALRMSAGDLLE